MDNNKKVILVVDDTPENIDLLVGILKASYKVKAAKSGLRALEVVQKSPPDLILLDINMPEMDGFEVCQRLQSDPTTKMVPIYFVSGDDDQTTADKSLALGARGFFHKPIDSALLLKTLAQTLSN